MYRVDLTDEAKNDLRSLRRVDIVKILDAVEAHLTHEPCRVSKSRIKRLREMSSHNFGCAWMIFVYFYDVSEDRVTVLGIVPKSRAEEWLKEKGKL